MARLRGRWGRVHVPHGERAVVAPHGQPLSVGAPLQRADAVAVLAESLAELNRRLAPELGRGDRLGRRGFVFAARRQKQSGAGQNQKFLAHTIRLPDF